VLKNCKSMNDTLYDKKLKKFLIPILRRKSLYWTGRTEAKNAARVERGLYKCRSCSNLFGPKEIELDHKEPVINVKTSWVSWDHYLQSLFCDASNFSVLCKNCHSSKTAIEAELRAMNKKKIKRKKA
jgi:5-methylcytosine-specific restriction endonuclease McrA